MSLATVSIVGNLVKDPEQFSFPSGRTKTRIVVAVNTPSRVNKGSEEADFYKVEAWGKLGELSANYLAKGHQVTVAGRLIFERWVDKEGRERRTPMIEANQIAFPRRLKLVEFNSSHTADAKVDDAVDGGITASVVDSGGDDGQSDTVFDHSGQSGAGSGGDHSAGGQIENQPSDDQPSDDQIDKSSSSRSGEVADFSAAAAALSGRTIKGGRAMRASSG